MEQNSNTAIKHVLKHEGSFVNHPDDPGGATNRGITIGTLSDWLGRPASIAEVKNLDERDAIEIYRRNYWAAMSCDDLPAGLDYSVMDMGVNAGPGRAGKMLQGIVGATKDGKIGPMTVAAVNSYDNDIRLISEFYEARLAYYQSLRTWHTFGRGWERRAKECLQTSLRMTGLPG